MTLRQFYYTSYVHQRSGKAGFQIKAMSPAIPPNLQTLLARLGAYRIPPTLDTRDLPSHPVALRYQFSQEGRAILLCSQSCGSDNYGRPGNFFLHALLLDEHPFSSIPPIFYWRSPLWCASDPQERAEIDSLPVLAHLDEAPSLDIDAVWNFLASGPRLSLLYRLLCAVIHQIRTVIIGECDEVVLWIAAVSCLLPPTHRPLLTFATYHHAPSQSPYLITGTTRECFSPSPADFQSYFILDEASGHCSHIADSHYAHLAAQAASAEGYEHVLLPIFFDHSWHFPRPNTPGDYLESIAHYCALLRKQPQQTLNKEEFQAVKIALTIFEHHPGFTSDECEELTHLTHLLHATLKQANTPEISDAFTRIQALLKQLNLPLAPFICEDLIQLTLSLLKQSPLETAYLSLRPLYLRYSQQDVLETLHSPLYLDWLAQRVEHMTPSQLLCLWRQVGHYLRVASAYQPLIEATLTFLAQLYQEQPDEARAVIETFIPTMQKESERWLQTLNKQREPYPQEFMTALAAINR